MEVKIEQIGDLINFQLIQVRGTSVKYLFNFTIDKDQFKKLKKDMIRALKEFKIK